MFDEVFRHFYTTHPPILILKQHTNFIKARSFINKLQNHFLHQPPVPLRVGVDQDRGLAHHLLVLARALPVLLPVRARHPLPDLLQLPRVEPVAQLRCQSADGDGLVDVGCWSIVVVVGAVPNRQLGSAKASWEALTGTLWVAMFRKLSLKSSLALSSMT